MNLRRILLHGTFLGCATLFCILLGFGIYTLLRPVNQILVQVPVAALLTIAAYLAFVWLLPRIGWSEMVWGGWREAALVLAGALLWLLLIFYAAHYLTQGYLARFSNVLAAWAFQLPVNALALWLAARLRPAALRNAHSA